MNRKMFITIFTFALILAYVTVEIPSYIHICKRSNPNLDECITNSINALQDNICKGIPELENPPFEPFIIKELIVSNVDNAKLYFKDVKITGICDFTITSLHIDLDKFSFNINVLFKRSYINGTYDFDIRILVPFVHQGPVYITTDNLEAKSDINVKKINRHNKTYIYMSQINLKLEIKTLEIKFDANEGESTQLNEILSTFLGNNKEELISRVKPPLEREISKQILKIANNIVKHFTYDELFPE